MWFVTWWLFDQNNIYALTKSEYSGGFSNLSSTRTTSLLTPYNCISEACLASWRAVLLAWSWQMSSPYMRILLGCSVQLQQSAVTRNLTVAVRSDTGLERKKPTSAGGCANDGQGSAVTWHRVTASWRAPQQEKYCVLRWYREHEMAQRNYQVMKGGLILETESLVRKSRHWLDEADFTCSWNAATPTGWTPTECGWGPLQPRATFLNSTPSLASLSECMAHKRITHSSPSYDIIPVFFGL